MIANTVKSYNGRRHAAAAQAQYPQAQYPQAQPTPAASAADPQG
ncbi:hypothetical protein [Streptacidiphilus sp. PAMC 29251]